ncbi:hypothetical protein MCOR16_002433 [Pyricularia oryzae]|nr:hypothetical protein MCOR15_011451 [Pyricularia oryzae]KAI6536426.1 hypothetical protein MCOR16_002433 [Pyricularia oryzae]
MDLFNLFANCFGSIEHGYYPFDAHEKPCTSSAVRSAHKISDVVVELLRTAEKNDAMLRCQIKDAVGGQGWTERIAHAIVTGLETLIKQGRQTIGPLLEEFINKAEKTTISNFDFPHEHPYLTAGFATIVAVGVLVLVAPWVVEALGFAELGPVADSFAAWWQSTYAGFVPKGSLFSFFQRFGIIWGRS